jgi:broad specificity phosphatase PhoE
MSFIPRNHLSNSGLKIYLVRHAESLNNIMCHDRPGEYETIRNHDPELSKTGHDQAHQLAQYIKQHEILSEICESNL